MPISTTTSTTALRFPSAGDRDLLRAEDPRGRSRARRAPWAALAFEILLNGLALFNHANATLPKVEPLARALIVTPDTCIACII
ncbi:MAG: hypothetical protein U1E30_05055 [Rhodoblastus sp.]